MPINPLEKLQTFRNINPLQTFYMGAKTHSKNVRFYWNVHLHLNKQAKVECKNRFEFGIQYPNEIYLPSQLMMKQDSHLLVQGDFAIFTGSIVSINRNAKVVLGSGYIGSNLRLCCFEAIDIGYDVAISEHVTIRDSDNHKLNSNPKISSPIKIGNHVWIGMNATILKGVTIGDGAVIAAGAVVNRDIPPKALAAGVPAIVKKEDVHWEK
jgi:acetyltransferase-like isoleucine patch superfamily enzyme